MVSEGTINDLATVTYWREDEGGSLNPLLPDIFRMHGDHEARESVAQAFQPAGSWDIRTRLAWSLRERTGRGLQSAGRLGSEGISKFPGANLQCGCSAG